MSIWVNQLGIQVPIRRSVIVHGNVLDIIWDSGTRKCVSVSETIQKTLLQQGYDEIVVWDRFQGGRSIKDPSGYDRIRSEAVSGNTEQQLDKKGEDYDLGDDDPSGALALGCNAGNDPTEFFSLIQRRMSVPNPNQVIAFVIDWSESLFGNANSLSEQERTLLMLLGKAINNAPVELEVKQLDRPQDLVILVTDKLASIPPRYYQPTAAITDVYVPLPTRKDRESFISGTLSSWRVRNQLQVGSQAFEEFVDMLDGMSLRDLQQLIRLSRQHDNDPLTIRKLLTLYRYGEINSPWEDLNRTRLMGLEDALKESVKGQNDAIQKVVSVIIRAFAGLSGLQHSSRQQTPKGFLFFVGPTGVGKTELAKALARFLFGDEEACIRFDMSEFNHEHSDQRLIGAPPGYVGYEEGGQLTNAVKERPFSVILFDEIEKAHGRILDKFLQILEDGRLTDGKGETVSFSETIVIFTSNIGAADIAVCDDEKEVNANFVKAVHNHFVQGLKRPELLNRIGDNIVPFNFLRDKKILGNIIRAKLKPIRERLLEKYRITDLVFQDEDAIIDALTTGFDETTGGRGILNKVASKLIDPLSEFLFEEGDSDSYSGQKIVVSRAGQTSKLRFKLE